MTSFSIHAPRVDAQHRLVQFRYHCDRFGGFEETVHWPHAVPNGAFEKLRSREGQALLRLTALMVGVSYHKAAASDEVIVEFPAGEAAMAALTAAYTEGLGEFYVRNQLSYPPATVFRQNSDTQNSATDDNETTAELAFTPKAKTALVAFGGGKDSHVAAGLMRRAGRDVELISIILSEKVGARLATMTDAPLSILKRTIDPHLIEISRSGEALNGHIPITSINSTILMLHALMHGHGEIVFANERAASEPTMWLGDVPVNHQYSKSIAFEGLLRAAFEEAGARASLPNYFSILRPVSELWTIQALVKKAPEALGQFASCNRNFVFAGKNALEDGVRWCGHCAKCTYTAVLLATQVGPDRLEEIMGHPVLGIESNMPFLRDVAGLSDAKPWECVGERLEVAAALAHIADQPEWAEMPLIKAILPELDQTYDRQKLRAQYHQSLSAWSEHYIPNDIAVLMQQVA
ncbi:MAG: hypothetical protein AAGF15_00645 [Pseudomonadota bacterium]